MRSSHEPSRPSDFERRWYSEPPPASLPPLSTRPPPPPIGHPRWSAVQGGIAGALGGFIMLIVAQAILDVRRVPVDLVRGLGAAVARLGIHDVDPRIVGLSGAAAIGAMAGAILGYLARRVLRFVPRVVFFTTLMPTIWLFVQSLVLGRFGSDFARHLPFGPLAIGAVVYGFCLAVVRPMRLG